MWFGADLINLGWKDSCLRAADYSRTSKLLPTQPEWVMYYWCFVDMYRTKIFTWVTMWRAIFESVFFPYESLTPGNCIGDRDSHGTSVSYIKRAFSPGKASLVQYSDQRWWLCRFSLLSVRPHQHYTYSKTTFLLLLLAGIQACGSGVGDLFNSLV